MYFSIETTKQLVRALNQLRNLKNGECLRITVTTTIYKNSDGYDVHSNGSILTVEDPQQAFDELVHACIF